MDRFSAHIDRAWDLISQGNGIQALLAARQALGLNGKSAEAHNLLGCIYAMDGDYGEALSYYQRAIDLDDDYLDPVLNAAELLLYSPADADEAIRYCERARSMGIAKEELLEVVLLEADALLNKGRVEEARRRLLEVDDAHDLSVVHCVLIGRTLYELGDFGKSRRYIDRALKKDPSCADALYCKGLLLREEGKRIDAVATFISVLESDRKNPVAGWLDLDEVGPVETLVRQAVHELDEGMQEMLSHTEIVVATLPSNEQVYHRELDPRQAVFADGINLSDRCFERLWVFTKNFDHVRISTYTAVEALAQLIQSELLFSQGPC